MDTTHLLARRDRLDHPALVVSAPETRAGLVAVVQLLLAVLPADVSPEALELAELCDPLEELDRDALSGRLTDADTELAGTMAGMPVVIVSALADDDRLADVIAVAARRGAQGRRTVVVAQTHPAGRRQVDPPAPGCGTLQISDDIAEVVVARSETDPSLTGARLPLQTAAR